jgi:hypothetical protein
LYEYLSSANTIKIIIDHLSQAIKDRFKVDTYEGFKIYAVILDIHTSRDMCLNCEARTYIMQQDRDSEHCFLRQLEKQLIEDSYMYVLPKIKNTSDHIQPRVVRLHFATRISSYAPNGLSRNHQPCQKLANTLSFWYRKFDALKAEDRDVKRFNNSVILHTDNDSWNKYKFYNQESHTNISYVMPAQTIFANTNSQTQSFNRP